jgi:predicted regulator of Ras-like GTPase activity (Roadblock/LC7/MglB family)
MNPAAQSERASKLLAELTQTVAGVKGALVASLDGYPLADHVPGHDANSMAAIIASSCGLGQRLAQLAGDGTMKEIVVHSDNGYVVIYTLGDNAILTVLTAAAVNLAMLHLRARDLVNDLAHNLPV